MNPKPQVKNGRRPLRGVALEVCPVRLHPDLLARIDALKINPKYQGNRRVVIEHALDAYFTTLESA